MITDIMADSLKRFNLYTKSNRFAITDNLSHEEKSIKASTSFFF